MPTSDSRRRERRAHAAKPDKRRIRDRRAEHDQQRVRERVCMLDAVAIDQRVAADRDGDDAAERGAAAAARAADEQDARGDNQNAAELTRGRVRADDGHREHERRDRREPARDRIDERQVEVPIRSRQERDIQQLERARGNDVFPRVAVDVPREHGERRQHEDERDDGHGRRGLRIARAAEQQVPDGVQRRRAERQQERRGSHAASSSRAGSAVRSPRAACRRTRRRGRPSRSADTCLRRRPASRASALLRAALPSPASG